MTVASLIREQQRAAWRTTPRPDMIDIPPSQAQLLGRISADAFDGGHTVRWLTGLGSAAVYRSVRDQRTGHTIHCVTDRPFDALTADLEFGLRLMAWMSSRPYVWYWWDQPWTRELPAGVDPGRDHVNGGWAVPGVLEVHVYRREEAHKVMIHESIHALGLDVPTAAIGPVLSAFERDLGRQLWPHLGEAFTELFAEWLWSIVTRRAWRVQEECSARQAAQVWARVRDSREGENTNVFAYYVLKWVLMGHLDAVLLAPDHSVARWYEWWLAARPRLEAAAKIMAGSEFQDLRMGMTCGGDLPL